MSTRLNNYTDKLERIINCQSNYAKLSNKLDFQEGEITLKKLDLEIKNKRQLRYIVLKYLYEDITKKLISKKITNFKVYISSNEIFTFDYLNLDLELNDLKEKVFINLDGEVMLYKKYDQEILDCLEIIKPFLKSFMNLRNNLDFNNLLSNDFYNQIDITLYGYSKPIFSFNGDGVKIIYSDLLNEDERKMLSDFYLQLKYDILNNVWLYNNSILDNYRTDVSKRKILTSYKKGIK